MIQDVNLRHALRAWGSLQEKVKKPMWIQTEVDKKAQLVGSSKP